MAPLKYSDYGLSLYANFKPTIDFNMLQYISSSASQVTNSLEVSNFFNNLLGGLFVDFNNLIILER